MPDLVNKQLSSLQDLSKSNLARLWKDHFHSDPDPHLRRDMMMRMLAYRMQEQAFGSLASDLIARLRKLSRTIEVGREAPTNPGMTIKPGTRLVRRWKGRNHLVTIEHGGFEYRGTRYESLSQIARLITGTRWSGPLFFGLRTKPESPKVQHGQ